MHLTIQSIVPKLDLIQIESLAYDIMIYSESWMKPAISSDSLMIANFHKPIRCDRHLFANITPNPVHFNTGSRFGQILHTRLRLECGALNNDLYPRNLIVFPFVSVAKLKLRPITFFNVKYLMTADDNTYQISFPTLRDLLFGAECLNDQENEEAFHKVHIFILETKRFLRT